ncbi:hypothetical protein GCM10008995_00280 [Halobellus salinus]|uniref:Cell division protein A N-terminal domain-containing protein n=1 Tax=Halobellus salinus TaxID=931585 RepID=A0A830EDB4_9EURY|nr:hypothetical protein [Halobellus salinus]GGI94040.1 hypothetical protein GCM10008995_00280 [Halobellus salinus]SMP19448.1 hypothetical protein SAMN06265347_10730 [Halobellus salinus]
MERNGLAARLHKWHRRFIGPVTDSRTVYAGFALFFAGVGLVVVSIATFLWSTTTDPAGTFKFVLRELAVVTGAAGIPTVLLGVTVLLPVSRRIDAVGAAGVGLCLVATARFAQVYPDAWYPNASVVVGLYAFGAVAVVATAGTALSGYYAEQTGRRLAREKLDENGDGAATGGVDAGETVTDEQVQADIDDAMSGAEVNWGGVERDSGRSITIRSPETDDVEMSGASAANTTESRGESVDDAVAGLRGLRGEGPKTESSTSGTGEQATALAELRATREESESVDDGGGIIDRVRSLFR